MTAGDTAKPQSHSVGALPRRLGLVSATALVIGEIIGVGIFLTPAKMAKSLGSPFWLLVVWGVMGLIAVCGAFCFAALAVRYPEDGGGYVYLRRAFGPRVAFLYGWMSLLVTDPGLTAMLAAGLVSDGVGALIPLSPVAAKLVAIGAILAVAAAHVLGLGIGAGLLRGLSILKLGLLGVIVAWGFGFGPGSWGNFRPFVERPTGADPLGGAIVFGLLSAFFTLAGWWDLNKVAGEVRDPERNVPRALLLGILLATIAYILISAVFWYLVPLSQVDPNRGFAQAGEALFGAAGGRVVSSIVVLSVLGSLAGILMSAPRVYYAMARDGLFPQWVAAIHPRFGTPARATLLQAAVASVLVATGSFQEILSYFMTVTIAFLALIAAIVYILPADKSVGRIPGYPLTPLGFLVPVLGVVVMTAMEHPDRAGIGLGVVLLGIPAYALFFGRGPIKPADSQETVSPPPSTANPNPDEA